MKLTNLFVKNFKLIDNLNLKLDSQLNLFVGVNGSGKSTVLEAISTSLSWLVKRIEREAGRGSYISDLSIRNGSDLSSITATVSNYTDFYDWTLKKIVKNKVVSTDSQLTGVSALAEQIRINYDKKNTLPVIAYYPVSRVVGGTIPNVPDKDSIYNLDVYDNALGGKANYASFFEWFRQQDDIRNQKSTSQSKWSIQNKTWINDKVNNLINLMKTCFPSDNAIFKDDFEYLLKRLKKDDFIYEEPRFLLREILYIIGTISRESKGYIKYEMAFRDIERMFQIFSKLNRKTINDSLNYNDVIEKFLTDLSSVLIDKNSDKNMVNFIWEAFSFSLLLSFWWINKKSRSSLEVELGDCNKRLYSSSNLSEIKSNIKSHLNQIIRMEIQQLKNINNGSELNIVTKAIEQFVPNYSNLRVERSPRPHMLIDKKGEIFNLDQLSDGEKNLIALIGDIARRFAIANPNHSNPLNCEGIILIDEIDLHLHPSWQRMVVPKLLEVFPKCQFFISTHSPQVISHVRHQQIFQLKTEENKLAYHKPKISYGLTLNRIVQLIMDDIERPEHIKQSINLIHELIARNDTEEASELLSILRDKIIDDPELLKAEKYIRRLKKRDIHK